MQDDHCHVDPMVKTPLAEELNQLDRARLSVSGMGCQNCSNRVRNSLLGLRGIAHAEVDHLRGIAVVDFNPELVELADMVRAVAAAGGDGRHEYSVLSAA